MNPLKVKAKKPEIARIFQAIETSRPMDVLWFTSARLHIGVLFYSWQPVSLHEMKTIDFVLVSIRNSLIYHLNGNTHALIKSGIEWFGH